MRRKLIATTLIVCSILLILTGCGGTPYNYDLSQYVTLGQYKEIEISTAEVQAQADASTQSLLSQNATETDVTDRAVQDGDIVNIDYEGLKDGVVFDGGSAVGVDLTIGSNSYIEGFESGLIGKKIGEKTALNLTFPKEYSNNPDLAGAAVVFNVTVNSIKTKTIPELTDDFVHGKYSYINTVDEYNTQLFESTKQNMVWNKVLESCTYKDTPKNEVKKYYDKMVKVYEYYAASSGTTLSAYVQSAFKTDMDGFLTQVVESSKSQVKTDMVFYALVRAENISYTTEEYDAIALKNAKSSGVETVDEYVKNSGKAEVERGVLWTKTMEFLSASAVTVK